MHVDGHCTTRTLFPGESAPGTLHFISPLFRFDIRRRTFFRFLETTGLKIGSSSCGVGFSWCQSLGFGAATLAASYTGGGGFFIIFLGGGALIMGGCSEEGRLT